MTQIPGTAPRVLIVDDDDGIRTLMKAILLRQHAEVDCVGDGDTALCTLRKKEYDAIVLDLMLPNTNGFEVLRYMKNITPELLPRTIVVTAASNMTLKDFEDGRLVRRILRKPFDIDEFVQEVFACSVLPAASAAVH
jgi:two-component system OmpR family response regulator